MNAQYYIGSSGGSAFFYTTPSGVYSFSPISGSTTSNKIYSCSAGEEVTCTGPIIGFLLVQVSTTGDIIAPAVGMLGFAIALALPFTLFALFPSWLKSMPKSGGWMNVIKVFLGFLELAFALKFLSVADLAYGWRILDRETFLALWIVIFALLGFYLLGKIRFPHGIFRRESTICIYSQYYFSGSKMLSNVS